MICGGGTPYTGKLDIGGRPTLRAGDLLLTLLIMSHFIVMLFYFSNFELC